MIELENEIIIDQAPDEVWRFVGNPEQWHTWREAMKEPATQLGNGAMATGTKFAYRSSFMGREVDTELETVAYEPEQAIGVTTDVPIEVRLAFRCESRGHGTRVVQETHGKVGGFFGIAEPLIKPLMKRQFQKDLESLKHVAEAQ